jgi:hypothetical protein
MLIEFDILGFVPSIRSYSTIAHIVVEEIEKWSNRYQIAIKIKFRANTITL